MEYLNDIERQKVIDNLNLVDYILQKKMHIYPNDTYYEDCQQEGRYALILAVHRYDESKGSAFSTYAGTYIEGIVKRYRREYIYGDIHFSRKVKDLLSKIVSLYSKGCTQREAEEILGMSEEEKLTILNMMNIQRLDNPIGEDNEGHTIHLVDTIQYNDPAFIDILGEELVLEDIKRVANKLHSDYHRDIWYDYAYSVYYGEGISQSELAKRYETSQANVSRILNKCKNLLLKFLED